MPHPATLLEIDQAFATAKATPIPSLEDRIALLNAFKSVAEKKKEHLTLTISKEMGKPLWDARMEVEALISKVPITIQAFQERCQEKQTGTAFRRFKPHGVAVVFGPFNFPMHLLNGHTLPALLAGNKVILKPSELTPLCGEEYFKLFEEAGFPERACPDYSRGEKRWDSKFLPTTD